MQIWKTLLSACKALPSESLTEVEVFIEKLARRERVRQKREDFYEQMRVFAAEHGGTELDLDPALEQAGLECIWESVEDDKWDEEKW